MVILMGWAGDMLTAVDTVGVRVTVGVVILAGMVTRDTMILSAELSLRLRRVCGSSSVSKAKAAPKLVINYFIKQNLNINKSTSQS